MNISRNSPSASAQKSNDSPAQATPKSTKDNNSDWLRDKVSIEVGGDGTLWEQDHRPYYRMNGKQLAQFVADNRTGGVTNTDKTDPDANKVEEGRAVLDHIRALGEETGKEWFHTPEEMGGLNDFYRSKEGYELSFDFNSPQEFFTPEGKYTFGSSMGGDGEKFVKLIHQNFNVEVVEPKKPYIPSHGATGPVLRLHPKD